MEKTLLEGKKTSPLSLRRASQARRKGPNPQSIKKFLKGKSQHLARLLQKYLSSWQNTFTSHRQTSEMTPRESVKGNPGKEATIIKERSLSLCQMPCFYIILSLLRGVISFPQRYPVTSLQQHSRDVLAGYLILPHFTTANSYTSCFPMSLPVLVAVQVAGKKNKCY